MKLTCYSKVLITGSTSKLGVALAREFAKRKIPLLLTGRKEDILQDLKETLSKYTTIKIIPLDLTKNDDLQILLDLISKESPDLIINSAGIGLYGPLLSHSLQDHLKIIKLNCEILFSITYESARILKKIHRRGTILNISSAADIFPYPFFSTYSASKAFVTNFSNAFDEEMRKDGIRILNCVPGPFTTDFRVHASKGYYNDMEKDISPEEAVKEILFQIQADKQNHVFPKKIRFGRNILRYLLPKFIMYAYLKRGLKRRIRK